jgi:hypothetical protein
MQRLIKVLVLTFAISGLTGAAHAQSVVFGRSCDLDEVASFDNRVHLHCKSNSTSSDPTNAANWFITSAAMYLAVEVNSPMAQSVTQIGLAALDKHTKVFVIVDSDPDHNPPGCLAKDCRRLVGVVKGPN